jgi:hypothetical protein
MPGENLKTEPTTFLQQKKQKQLKLYETKLCPDRASKMPDTQYLKLYWILWNDPENC